jgi:hypothetical protein
MELLRVDRVAGFPGWVIGTVAARALERHNPAPSCWHAWRTGALARLAAARM